MLDPSHYKPPEGFDFDAALRVIGAENPELDLSDMRVLGNGFDNVALSAAGHIFRFPRNPEGRKRLRGEVELLRLIRSHVDMAVPDLQFYGGPPAFSCHREIPGEVFLVEKYLALSDADRDRMAEQLAELYAQLHEIPVMEARAAGAGHVEGFLALPEMQTRLKQLLSEQDWHWAERVFSLWQDLPPDPLGEVFGWFDGHGWNMAIDPKTGHINGVFDFADSGIGPVHDELMETNLLHPDLTARVNHRYSRLTGRDVDPQRIAVLTSMHRLSDLAKSHDHPIFGELTWELFRVWLKQPESRV